MVTVGELLQGGASVLNKEDAAALLCFLLKTDRAGLCLKRLDTVSKQVQSEYKKYVYLAYFPVPYIHIFYIRIALLCLPHQAF